MALLSAAVLGTEIALTRVFAYLIWYHAVFMILSMALLGFAASGSLLTLGGEFFQNRPGRWIRRGAISFAVLAITGIFIPMFVSLESEGVSLQSIQHLRNLAVYFIYWGVAFMMAGASIALMLQHRREKLGKLYFASLVGSGLGCLLTLGLLYFGPVVTLATMSLVALFSALVVPIKKMSLIFRMMALLLSVGIAVMVSGVIKLKWQVASSKGEFYQLAKGTLEKTHWTPISVVQVFKGPSPGWRYGDTGLAIHYRKDFPKQKGIIIDAYAQSAFTDWHDQNMRSLDFYPFCSTSVAYLLCQKPRVLVIGIGGGIDILRALYFGGESVTGVELNGVLIDLLRGPYRDFTGDLAHHPRVTLVKDEGRSYVKHSSEEFDIIQINYTDTWSASASGALALAENFIYTTEAIQDYYSRLSDRGVISITRTLSKPYRETLRVVLTAMKALSDLGIEEPGHHLLAVASVMAYAPQPHMSATLLVSKQPFSEGQIDKVKNAGRGKWLVLFRPDNKPLPPVTRFDAPIDEQYYRWVREKMDEARETYASFMADFPDDTSVLDAYRFDVSPLTDNRPFYYFYFRWGDIWKRFKTGSISGEAGGVMLLVVLVLALAGSAIGIFLPLFVWKWRVRKKASLSWARTACFALYFSGLGLGYIMVELNLIQKFSLFLGHPVYALGTTLAGLLALSGIGSYLSVRVRWRAVPISVLLCGIIAAIIIVMALPGLLFRLMAGSPVWKRALATLVAIGPLGMLMGMPFPLGLKQAGITSPGLIPWMWGVNGFMSVIGSILAIMIAITYGYGMVTVSAAAAYLIALVSGLFLIRDLSY